MKVCKTITVRLNRDDLLQAALQKAKKQKKNTSVSGDVFLVFDDSCSKTMFHDRYTADLNVVEVSWEAEMNIK